jgi:hypothetical protein
MELQQPKLSNLQMELLKLSSRNVSDEDVIEIRRLIARYFADKATVEADKIWDEKGWTSEDAERMLHEHMRTPYNSLQNITHMNFIEPDDVDLTVVHSHLSDAEAEEIAAYIQQYKATHGTAPAALKVEVTDKKDLDFLIALLQQLNLKWTLTDH